MNPQRQNSQGSDGSRGRREPRNRSETDSVNPISGDHDASMSTPSWWRLWIFLFILGVDTIVSSLLLTPVFPRVEQLEDIKTSHYTLHGSLWDLSLLAIPRILSALFAVIIAYHRLEPPSESPFELNHPTTGERKSLAELEEESLEEPFLPKIRRYVHRMGYLTECSVLLTGSLLAAKCLARLNVEIGVFDEAQPEHPLFWAVLATTALCSLLEVTFVDAVEKVAGELGRKRRSAMGERTWVERLSGSLAEPLLSSVNSEADLDGADNDEENRTPPNGRDPTDANSRGYSDIGADPNYKAKLSDLLNVCAPDRYLIMLASVFLLCAAIANIFVPKYTGKILDALVAEAGDDSPMLWYGNSTDDDDSGDHGGGSIVRIPGFVKNIELLVLASILGGVFGGVRGAIFTLVGARVNVRLRIKLMDSLLSQDIGFYDTTRTGDITSRLSSDTTLVGASITTNVNIFLRSMVQAVGVLIFMCCISWQLSLLAFITIPVISVLSRMYGRYIRRLSKLQQKKLAEGNSVSESSISAMATVRTFGAETVELAEFEQCMENYITLNKRAATATLGYSTCVGALPELVKALVLFYGGLLVQSDGPNHISSGQLISFVLYLSYLSSAFSSLGGIYASLVRAIGAADKVFELTNRIPRLRTPSHVDPERLERARANRPKGLLSVKSNLVVDQRAAGLYPEKCAGEVTFKDVQSRYPARPQRVVLDGMNLTIPAGAVVALVGASGSGKSSVVKLLQHLYEPCRGQVCIDGIPVQELSADWLCRNVSVVSQEPILFARTVRRNIIYGLEGTADEPSQADVEEAARLANATAFIESLPNGYDTEVGERGIQLSGGQKQRIAIARALVRKPRILAMDEATSALDAESEHIVQTAIDDMINGQRSLDGDPSRSMTVIIVAHRLSTVRNADCIFVVDNGKVVEQGNHDELASKQDGVYNGLIRRQLGHKDDA